MAGLHTSSVPTETPVPPASLYAIGGVWGIDDTL